MRREPGAPPNCSHEHDHHGSERTLDLIGDKWTMAVIHHLAQGCNRFGALQRSMRGINSKTLSLRLRRLEADGIITRKIYPEVPLHIEYRLTAKGKSLQRVFRVMDEWGKDLAEAGQPVDDLAVQ